MTNLLAGTNEALFFIGVLCFVLGALFTGISWGRAWGEGEPNIIYTLMIIGGILCITASVLIAFPLLN